MRHERRIAVLLDLFGRRPVAKGEEVGPEPPPRPLPEITIKNEALTGLGGLGESYNLIDSIVVVAVAQSTMIIIANPVFFMFKSIELFRCIIIRH